MPSYLYIGDDERYFPDAGVNVVPGETVELPENPDPRWFDPVGQSSPNPPAVEPVADPAIEPPEELNPIA